MTITLSFLFSGSSLISGFYEVIPQGKGGYLDIYSKNLIKPASVVLSEVRHIGTSLSNNLAKPTNPFFFSPEYWTNRATFHENRL